MFCANKPECGPGVAVSGGTAEKGGGCGQGEREGESSGSDLSGAG